MGGAPSTKGKSQAVPAPGEQGKGVWVWVRVMDRAVAAQLVAG